MRAKKYPNTMLHLFINFVDNDWLPKHTEDYFKERDAHPLRFLAKVLS
ncbi:hypothetical protein [Pricia antarctica]|nr:hypothetical protein [Pricia antarctica]